MLAWFDYPEGAGVTAVHLLVTGSSSELYLLHWNQLTVKTIGLPKLFEWAFNLATVPINSYCHLYEYIIFA